MPFATFWDFVRWSSSNISYGHFKIWLTFWPRDLVIWTLTYKNNRILCCVRLHIWTKFSDDWSKTSTCIVENVTISFKYEYRRHTLTSRCDVIGDVIIMKIILVDDLHTIFRYLLSNWGYIENCEIFKTDENLRSGQTFSSYVSPEVRYVIWIASPISYILSFWSKF